MVVTTTYSLAFRGRFPGGGVGAGLLPIVAYTRRLHPKGVHFSGFRYMKGEGFYKLKYRKWLASLSFRSVKKPKRLIEGISGREKVEKFSPFCDLFIQHKKEMQNSKISMSIGSDSSRLREVKINTFISLR